MPKEAGIRLQTDLQALRTEVGRLRTVQEQEHAAKLEHDMASDGQVAALKKRMDESTRLSHHAEADIGSQIERMLEDVQKLRGAVEDNEHRIGEAEGKWQEQLAQRLESLRKAGEQREREAAAQAAKRAIPAGKKEQLHYARKLLREQRSDEGRSILRDLCKRFGKERGIGDEALFTLAADAQAAGKNDAALRDYVRLLDTFPNGPHTDEAYYGVAQASLAMDRPDDARTFFREVVSNFPKSPLAKQAKRKLAELAAAKPPAQAAAANGMPRAQAGNDVVPNAAPAAPPAAATVPAPTNPTP